MFDLDFLANWSQILSLFVALVAIIVPILSQLRQNRRKELSKSHSVVSLYKSPGAYGERLQLLFDDKPVHNPSLARISFLNSGNVPIVPSDFVAPITIQLGPESEILEAMIADKSPENLDVSLQVSDGTVAVEPDLLNPSDMIEIQILGTQIGEITVDSRIAGIQRIVNSKRGFPSARDYVSTIWPVLILAALAFFLRSSFLWGFVTAGILGFVLQNLQFHTVRVTRQY